MLAAGVVCALAVGLKYRFGYDDSLDVVGVHLVGGLVGTLGIGLLATAAAPTGVDGLLYGGGVDQLGKQLLGGGVVLVYAFVVSGVIGLVVDRAMGFRIDEEHEVSGHRPGRPRGDGVRPARDRRGPRRAGYPGRPQADRRPGTRRLRG